MKNFGFSLSNAKQWATGAALGAAVLLAGAPAQAQLTVDPETGAITVGDASASGYALRFACAGAEKEIFLISNRDLENAFGKALGSEGMVRRVAFEDEDRAAFVDMQRVESDEKIGAAPAYVYKILVDRETDPTAKAFAELVSAGDTIVVDRFDDQILIEGLSDALAVQEARCPF